ncbi:MAG: hypothetical protein IKR48_08680, partial [Kiritimatiellae bacterium]|nr:hypothetical protein [Kiritimatiellia bacterium]
HGITSSTKIYFIMPFSIPPVKSGIPTTSLCEEVTGGKAASQLGVLSMLSWATGTLPLPNAT